MDNNINNFNIVEETYSSDEDESPRARELYQEFHRGSLTWAYKNFYSTPSNYKAGEQPKYPANIQVNVSDILSIKDYAKENSRTIQEDQEWIQRQEPLYYKLRLQRLHNLKAIITKKCNRDCIKQCKKWLRRHPRASIKKQVEAFEKFDLVRRQVINFCCDNPSIWIEGTYLDYNHPSNIHLEVCWNTARNKSIYKTVKEARRVFISRL